MNESDICSLSTRPNTRVIQPSAAPQRFVEVNPDEILHIWECLDSRSTSSQSQSNKKQNCIQINTDSFSEIF
ncbi:unnamed protein product [Blepharisma stoltei]|uniref:Uncharacterized protein n=1 Tax=Blepharisma stoltei TaxID=1481888 RepID=A0AAU9JBW9_9CILI|nr:unnamed protein product [Blepharisma stoltei]